MDQPQAQRTPSRNTEDSNVERLVDWIKRVSL